MNESVYLRPLSLEDAKTSYQWRKDPDIWVYTEFKPSADFTLEQETEWLRTKLNKENDSRFAICLHGTDQYIGNVQLIDLKDSKGEFHLFIGEKQLWGRGIGKSATKLILKFGFSEKKLESVFLFAHEDNTPALSIYEKLGFVTVSKHNNQLKMVLTKHMFTTDN
ncbi:MAG: GNAT family N-acetyltransferase [Candidatus Pedobacter colombiensis]|uniref:GNAT family N-acetyltransferase n=1 Tax=Candidatus Pedobacter colombiensis TaxID=3121371 RepID=A0AAJ5WD13_9SPHI|nr:GNAT family N-acetyltransferase [Pedobacter sp.]WEK21295.1 MAG: GNAT family N-acetyltransferase [Pedobacter sp.]